MRHTTCRPKLFRRLMHDPNYGTETNGQLVMTAVSAEQLRPSHTVPRPISLIRIDAPHADNGPAAAIPDVAIEKQLQLAAIQLASIRFHYPSQSLWQRAKIRFRNEFLNASPMAKLRFLRSAATSLLARIVPRNAGALRRRATNNPPKTSELSVAVVCHGGMGDLIIASNFLDRFVREYGCPPVDVVLSAPQRVKEGEFVFYGSPAVRRITCRANVDPGTTSYDVVLKIGDFFSCEHVDEERVRSLAPEFHGKLACARQIQKPYRGFIEASPLYDGQFATVAARSGLRRLDVLGWLAHVPFTQDDQLCLAPDVAAYRYVIEEAGLAGKSYITIHNGFDNVALRGVDTVTKAWPESHYVEFVERLKARFPEVLVVQVGASTSRPIANADLCLLNATSLHDAAWILKHSLLHIDGDSGMVHMARALHTRSLVLFGPTNRDYFRYAANENLSSASCNNCWWTTPEWVRRCPRGLAEPECMKSIEPINVFHRAEAHIAGLASWELRVEEASFFVENSEILENGRMDHMEIAGAFRRWQDRFVMQSLRRDDCAETRDRSLTVLSFDYDLKSQLAEMGYDTRVLNFGRDFGSLHNIPAENESYDVVVMPSFTERIPYLNFAIKEAIRIVKEGGRLVLAFQFSQKRQRDSAIPRTMSATFFQALEDHGVECDELACPTAGGMVLRKCVTGRGIV